MSAATASQSGEAQDPASSVHDAQPKPAISDEEKAKVYMSMGLGRGVNATDSHPWTNKGSYQVRSIIPSDLLETNLGGNQQMYQHEISSERVQQGSLKASVAVPNSPVNVGIDMEMSRSVTGTRYVIGRKVQNRTISFKENASYKEFEEKLCKWILERIHEGDSSLLPKKDTYFDSSAQPNPVEVIEEILKDGKTNMQDYCYRYISECHITHYVSSVELGAAEYQVYTSEEYYRKFGSSGNVDVNKVLQSSGSFEDIFKFTSVSKDVKKIGVISKDGTVAPGSPGEAVIGVRFLPITNLVTLPQLQSAVEAMLLKYIDSESHEGPFLISTCDKLYLTVNDTNFTVGATLDKRAASLFCIRLHDEVKDTFFIAYTHHNKNVDDTKHFHVLHPTARYLDTEADTWGHSAGPLQLKFAAEGDLSLISRTGNKHSSTSVRQWMNCEDVFYIRSPKKWFKKDTFVCVKKCPNDEFITACVPNIKYHDEQTFFMLFRLLPASFVDKDLF